MIFIFLRTRASSPPIWMNESHTCCIREKHLTCTKRTKINVLIMAWFKTTLNCNMLSIHLHKNVNTYDASFSMMTSTFSLLTSQLISPPLQSTAFEQELLQEYSKLVENINSVIDPPFCVWCVLIVMGPLGVNIACRYVWTPYILNSRLFKVIRKKDRVGFYFFQCQCLCYSGMYHFLRFLS